MAGVAVGIADQGLDPVGDVGAVIGIVVRAEIGRADSSLRPRRKGNFRFGSGSPVRCAFSGTAAICAFRPKTGVDLNRSWRIAAVYDSNHSRQTPNPP
jgi:hypothetical protein